VDLAIDAIDRLRSAGIDAELDIVGDVFRGYEWYERQLREQISRLALEDRVRIVGFQRMVWDIVSAADVAVVPSRGDESFGNVLIEALMCARPVVAADHSGLREASGGSKRPSSFRPTAPMASREVSPECETTGPQCATGRGETPRRCDGATRRTPTIALCPTHSPSASEISARERPVGRRRRR
jgi:hypothetical protein